MYARLWASVAHRQCGMQSAEQLGNDNNVLRLGSCAILNTYSDLQSILDTIPFGAVAFDQGFKTHLPQLPSKMNIAIIFFIIVLVVVFVLFYFYFYLSYVFIYLFIY